MNVVGVDGGWGDLCRGGYAQCLCRICRDVMRVLAGSRWHVDAELKESVGRIRARFEWTCESYCE